MKRTGEAAFETVIEAHLLENGYMPVAREGFDRERAIFPETVLAFIRETQPKEWDKLEALHGDKTCEQVLVDLCKWMDTNGALATLRHGFKCYGRTLHVAFFKAAHELNPELEARYAANCVGLTRQLHYSPRSEHSIDVTLSLNGIPVVTLELKNPLTGQRVEDARRQYKQDREPREPIFEFKRRTLVHFAVDTESALMTTRLAGPATHFLPFNKGCAGAAGNPPDPEGRNYRTAYLWEEVLQRDSLLDLLARFIHLQIDEKRDDQGRKVKTESMIFPRYHQLEAVRMLVDAARSEGVGHNYLVEHSAGSGKSNTIGWLTHRLASLHNAANERVFDSVIVVTDRVVLDQQLQDTIYQFEHKRGVVQRIDESSRQLAEALESLVAFSGKVVDDKPADVTYTEPGMNDGISEKELPEKFATQEYQVLLVAEKYQTGFDQPLLHTMYVDKRLAGIQAVQTLSRLNRIHPLKEDTFVLDFVNDREEIREAFKIYYEGAGMGEEVDPMRMYAIKGELDAAGIYLDEEVERFSAVYFKPKRRSPTTVCDRQPQSTRATSSSWCSKTCLRVCSSSAWTRTRKSSSGT